MAADAFYKIESLISFERNTNDSGNIAAKREKGRIHRRAFLSYVMTTLAIIQIWNYSTYYINVYGRHSVREHIFMFVIVPRILSAKEREPTGRRIIRSIISRGR